MKYSVVIFPSGRVQEVANSYRKRYDPTFALIPPYIRLKEAFELGDAQLPALIAHLEDVAQQTVPFSAHFHKVSSFYPANNVLYLAIENKEPLEQLHQRIIENDAKHKETYAYIPHVTIGRDLSSDELKDLTGQLRMTQFDLTCTINDFHLIHERENGIWSVSHTFTLQK